MLIDPSSSVRAFAEDPACVHLTPDSHLQADFFVANILDASPKDDLASMEHPLFALRAGDKRIRSYEHNGCKVTVFPGAMGCATIHDKDLWIYCISNLIEAKNRGRKIIPVVRFTAYDFLVATNRGTSGRDYERLIAMLRRLKGTVVETNIKTHDLHERRGFGLIDSWRVIEKAPATGTMLAVEVELPRWLFRSIETKRVLTLSRDYFSLRKPLDRRIYELARKHCGNQPRWRISLKMLHIKTGSSSTLRRFRFDMDAMAQLDDLPSYHVAFDANQDMITFTAKSASGKLALQQMLAGYKQSLA